MSWAEVKAKQAENIAKLYEKNTDDWFYKSQMNMPEEERTGFAPNDGKCYYCNKEICEGDKAITVESLGDYIITGTRAIVIVSQKLSNIGKITKSHSSKTRRFATPLGPGQKRTISLMR